MKKKKQRLPNATDCFLLSCDRLLFKEYCLLALTTSSTLWLKEGVTEEAEVGSPDHPDQLSTTEKLPPSGKDEEKDNEQQPSDLSHDSIVFDESGRLEELRQALQQAEQQNQLLNSEYSKLLREKEVPWSTFLLVIVLCL